MRDSAEGLELTPDRDLIEANTQEKIVKATLNAIHHPDEIHHTAGSSRLQALARYSWDLLAERLDSVWNAIAQESALVGAYSIAGSPVTRGSVTRM